MQSQLSQLTQETLVIGFLTLVIGVVLKKIIKLIKLDNKTKLEYHLDEIGLFLIGPIVHLIFEFSGLNKIYCVRGAACQM